MSEEKTGETMYSLGAAARAGMEKDFSDVAADLPRRRLAVRAEVMGRVVEELEKIEASKRTQHSYDHLVVDDGSPAALRMEEYFVGHVAELIFVITNLAMVRGAGVPVEEKSPQDILREQDERWARRPPATAESLGEQL